MNAQIFVLLDSPAEEALGMVPMLVKVDGSWEVWGVKDKPRWPIAAPEADDLLAHPRLIKLDPPVPVKFAPGLAAGWIGQKWRAEADALKLFPWTHSPSDQKSTERGYFWVDTTQNIYQQLQDWLKFAAVRFYREEDKQSVAAQTIARLMRWTLPDDPHTMAVMIDSKADTEAKNQRVEWYLELQRLERPDLSRDTFHKELDQIRQEVRIAPKKTPPRVYSNPRPQVQL